MPAETNEMLTVKQVAERLNVSIQLVYQEIADGVLGHHRFGKRAIRVSEEQLAAYAAQTKQESEPETEGWSPKFV